MEAIHKLINDVNLVIVDGQGNLVGQCLYRRVLMVKVVVVVVFCIETEAEAEDWEE